MNGGILTCQVPSPRIAAFEARLSALLDLADRQPGHCGTDVLRGVPGVPGSRVYHIVHRFANEASLRAWNGSAERAAHIAAINALATRPPSRWKMAVLTWLGIWPLMSLALWQVAPRLDGLPLLAKTATITVMLVLTMTYVVMPRFMRLAGPWLARR